MLRMYRGQMGMVSWALHRLTGLGILLFLIIHIADIFIIGYGPEAFNEVLFIYNNPFFRILEIVLVGAVYYHAINGVRIVMIDFWDRASLLQKELFWGVIIIFLATFIPTAILMIAAMF